MSGTGFIPLIPAADTPQRPFCAQAAPYPQKRGASTHARVFVLSGWQCSLSGHRKPISQDIGNIPIFPSHPGDRPFPQTACACPGRDRRPHRSPQRADSSSRSPSSPRIRPKLTVRQASGPTGEPTTLWPVLPSQPGDIYSPNIAHGTPESGKLPHP
jgi:hypothetical protein